MTLPTEPGNASFPRRRLDTGARQKNWRIILGFLGLMALFVALRWNSYDAPLTRDEGEYAYSAWLLEQGIAPYEHSFLQKPPMVVYSYYLAERLAPRTDWFPRIVADVFMALSTLLLGAMAWREFGPGCGMTAMWLMTPMVLLPHLEEFMANTEMFLLLPLLGTVAIYIFARKRSRGWHWFCAGFLAALTLLYKFTVFPILLLTILAWSYEEWKARGLGTLMKWWLFYTAGGLIACSLVLAFFLKSDGGKSLWDCVVVFNAYYSQSDQFKLSAFGNWLGTFWSAWRILFVLPLVFLWKPTPRIGFWLALTVAALLSTYGSVYGHYYLPIMPFWAVVNAAAIRVIASWCSDRYSISAVWIQRLATALAVGVICWTDTWPLTLTRHQFQARMGPSVDSRVVAKKLARLTSPHDRILVAGSEPQILYYARRLSCTRFDLMYPLMIPTPLAKCYQQEAIAEVKKNRPAAVVYCRSNLSWLWQPSSPPVFRDFLHQLLQSDYILVGGYVESGNQGFWQAPLLAGNIKKCSLLLYQRLNRESEIKSDDQLRPDANPVFKPKH